MYIQNVNNICRCSYFVLFDYKNNARKLWRVYIQWRPFQLKWEFHVNFDWWLSQNDGFRIVRAYKNIEKEHTHSNRQKRIYAQFFHFNWFHRLANEIYTFQLEIILITIHNTSNKFIENHQAYGIINLIGFFRFNGPYEILCIRFFRLEFFCRSVIVICRYIWIYNKNIMVLDTKRLYSCDFQK